MRVVLPDGFYFSLNPAGSAGRVESFILSKDRRNKDRNPVVMFFTVKPTLEALNNKK